MPISQSSRRPHRSFRGFAVILIAPAVAAVIASLWPLERVSLIITCVALAPFALLATVYARTVRHLLIAVTTLAVLFTVPTSNWPLRFAYLASRSSLDQAAARLRAGDVPATPCRIGVFRIHKAEVNHRGVVCLWTNPAASVGFVQCQPQRPPFNLWSHQPLDQRWQFIAED